MCKSCDTFILTVWDETDFEKNEYVTIAFCKVCKNNIDQKNGAIKQGKDQKSNQRKSFDAKHLIPLKV